MDPKTRGASVIFTPPEDLSLAEEHDSDPDQDRIDPPKLTDKGEVSIVQNMEVVRLKIGHFAIELESAHQSAEELCSQAVGIYEYVTKNKTQPGQEVSGIG